MRFLAACHDPTSGLATPLGAGLAADDALWARLAQCVIGDEVKHSRRRAAPSEHTFRELAA